MIVSLLTCGTRGDTQPMIVLGRELQRRGHQVRLAASPNTLDLVRRSGLPALPFGPDSQQLMESEAGQRWLASGNVRSFMAELSSISAAAYETTRDEAIEACADADLVVAGILAEDVAAVLAESRGIPLVTLHSAPLRRNSTYPAPLVTTRRLPGSLNTLTGALFDQVVWRGGKNEVERLRKELGLAPTKAPLPVQRARAGDLELQAYDPMVVPGLNETPDRPLIGFLTMDDELRDLLGEGEVPAPLASWLDDGSPPVFFGFGSMPVKDPMAMVALICEVSRAAGVRALISAGWARLAAVDPDDPAVFVTGSFNHDLVLPRCRAAVHHGGAGTLAATLGAGLPTVVCSVFADQPFWGARVTELNAGTHLRFQDLDRNTLQHALVAALTDRTTRRAEQLGSLLRSSQQAAHRGVDLVEARTLGR